MAATAEAPQPLDPNFRIVLPSYEGPLDLLLHLIHQHELDILDLPVAFITERYLAYLDMMQRLDLEIAVEYLVMAATLAHIKSKMMLPPSEAGDDDDDDETEEQDPRAELIQRLLEYQKYKKAAEELSARGVLGRDTFVRQAAVQEAPAEPELAKISVFKLLHALEGVFQRIESKKAFEIDAERVSIQQRMNDIRARLHAWRQLPFTRLFDDVGSVYMVVVTFLAMLEMAKTGDLHIVQRDDCAPIYLCVPDGAAQDTGPHPARPERASPATGARSVQGPQDAPPQDADVAQDVDAGAHADLLQEDPHD